MVGKQFVAAGYHEPLGVDMTSKKHFEIFIIVSVVWLIFWGMGLPNYYQQYSFKFMLFFDVVLLIPLTGLIYFLLKKEKHNKKHKAIWLATYFTVPFFVYDLLYCGYYLGEGIKFTVKYWYLTIYYFIPWLICVPVAKHMENKRMHA